MGEILKISGIELQERDIALLRGLLESRVMTLAQAAKLYFKSAESAKKRLQRLKVAGLVRDRPRALFEPSALSITRLGLKQLNDLGHLWAFPRLGLRGLENRAIVSEVTLRHELAVMDVKVAFSSAIAARPHLEILEFSTWPKLSEFTISVPNSVCHPVTIKPDGFIRLCEHEGDSVYEHCFFLEVDRSTESQRVLAERAAGYAEFYRSGGFALRSGGKPEQFREYPFRVLVVCQNEERRNNAAQRMFRNEPPIRSLVWLTTYSEVLSDPLGRTWITPALFARLVTGNLALGNDISVIYRRSKHRERLLNALLSKLPLF